MTKDNARAPLPGRQIFDRLKSLEGVWEGKFSDGQSHTVAYRQTAHGHSLVETWTMANAREAVTIYALDGEDLVATHFCPWGNQPRLMLVDTSSGRFQFVLTGGDNLSVPGAYHQHRFWLRIDGPDEFARSETYIENDLPPGAAALVPDGEEISYRRIPG